MFLVKVGSVSALFFFIFLNDSFASVQYKNIISEMDENITTEYKGLFSDFTGRYDGSERNLRAEKKPFAYRRQDLNESVEKIQNTDNGVLTKSTYIRDFSLRKDNFQPNGSLNPTRANDSPPENYVVKDGKKHKIVRVKKTVKSLNGNKPIHQMQRRTFAPVQNFMSFLSPKWMTRQRKNATQSERSKNGTERAKPSPPCDREESSKEALGHEVRNSEKIKKLLNLFTIVKFDNGECYANGIKGTCLHQVECEGNGGKSVASCAAELGVCCYYEKTCGETSNDDNTFFINDGYPDSSNVAPKVCTLTLKKSNPDVKQLRLDFEIFQLREPTNGTCLHDRLVISGQDVNDIIPEICGYNTGQHVYVDVEDSKGPFNLNVVAIGEYFPRNFRIKVTQIKNGDELLVPKNCLQYYAEPAGHVQTFNYQLDINDNLEEVDNGYFNNLNYAICVKKQKGFCTITYENEEMYGPHPAFHLVNVDEDGVKLLPPGQAGAETFDCPDDYIVINGIRLCGERLNDASIDADYTRNFPVTDTTNGPFIIYVKTDATVSGRGFKLKYTQHPCLI